MKVIDLLNKIANGEEIRFRVIQADEVYRIGKGTNLYSETCEEDVKWYIDEIWLNYEVEIIEEDKKIEKIEKIQQRTDTGLFGSMVNDEIKVAETINKQANYLSDIVSTINEIIDKLNEMEKE